MALKRLDKLISLNCNVSRKDARALIKNGSVRVNSSTVLRAEELIDTEKDDISVKGYIFSLKDHVYLMMNKPEGVISATEDPNKKTVIDLIPDNMMRRSMFPCGRLDRDTTGLLILTDDGEYCHKIMSPSHHVSKIYLARLSDPLTPENIEKLREGVVLRDETECLPAEVITHEKDGKYYAFLRIREGKYHQVKRMIAACSSSVEALRRIMIGSLPLDLNLEAGECRELSDEELEKPFEDCDFSEENLLGFLGKNDI